MTDDQDGTGSTRRPAIPDPNQEALLVRMRNAVLATRRRRLGPQLTPVWYLWDGQAFRISTPSGTVKVHNVRRDPEISLCVDDPMTGAYVTAYGRAEIVAGERVAELTRPLLLKYLPPDEADVRWRRINANGDRVVILLRPTRFVGREGVR